MSPFDRDPPDPQKIEQWQRTVSYLYTRCKDEDLLAVPEEDEERVNQLLEFLSEVQNE